MASAAVVLELTAKEAADVRFVLSSSNHRDRIGRARRQSTDAVADALAKATNVAFDH